MAHNFKTSEVAQRCGVSYQTAYLWIRRGELKASRFGKQYRISEADLMAFEDAARNWWVVDHHA